MKSVVSDNGPGLPEEVRERVFEPFVSTKPDGIGIGLSICRTIVEAHGGKIAVDAEYENAEPDSAFRFRSSMNRVAEMSGELIFVVDDDDAVRASLQALLETAGYRTALFESGLAFFDLPGRWPWGMRPVGSSRCRSWTDWKFSGA